MNKLLVIIFILLLYTPAIAQLEPTPEDMEKYAYLSGMLDEESMREPDIVKLVDSLYNLDSNSVFLKLLLSEINIRLITDSLKTERIPRQISILNSLIAIADEEGKHDLEYLLALMYKYSGDYKKAVALMEKQMAGSGYERERQYDLYLIASAYTDAGKHYNALEASRLLDDSYHSIKAEVYYNNGFMDSALYHAEAINEEEAWWSDYAIKAKVLLYKGQYRFACESVTMATTLLENEGMESLLHKADKDNLYVAGQIKRYEEVYSLKKQYCD